MANPFCVRRSIMVTLYRVFQENPYLAVELSEIDEECGTDPKTLNWNIVYLEKCGYVELGKSHDSAPYIAPFASLTATGIDLVENRTRFNDRFPLKKEETPDA